MFNCQENQEKLQLESQRGEDHRRSKKMVRNYHCDMFADHRRRATTSKHSLEFHSPTTHWQHHPDPSNSLYSQVTPSVQYHQFLAIFICNVIFIFVPELCYLCDFTLGISKCATLSPEILFNQEVIPLQSNFVLF